MLNGVGWGAAWQQPRALRTERQASTRLVLFRCDHGLWGEGGFRRAASMYKYHPFCINQRRWKVIFILFVPVINERERQRHRRTIRLKWIRWKRFAYAFRSFVYVHVRILEPTISGVARMFFFFFYVWLAPVTIFYYVHATTTHALWFQKERPFGGIFSHKRVVTQP